MSGSCEGKGVLLHKCCEVGHLLLDIDVGWREVSWVLTERGPINYRSVPDTGAKREGWPVGINDVEVAA